jgi:hypothetical protein
VNSRVRHRARLHDDRAGDPLDGLVNLFDLGVVLAVAFLLASLSALKLTGVLTGKDVAVVQQPGSNTQTIVVKQGDRLVVTQLTGQQVAGTGTRLGTVYRLSDGRLVYVDESGRTSAPTTTTTVAR